MIRAFGAHCQLRTHVLRQKPSLLDHLVGASRHRDDSGMVRPKALAVARLIKARWRITQDDYDKKARELKDQQAEIAARIEQHQQGNAEYRTTLESLISLASRAVELFERSKTEQKRQLLAFVFSNLAPRGKKLEFSLRSPFDLMVDRRSYTSWLGM
jgi:hypothetical protein